MNEILKVKNLYKQYGNFSAVKGIDFSVSKGEIFALIGPNGAGKSTTLKMVTTILTPTSGSIKIAGINTVKDAQKVRNLISYLPEEAGAYKRLTGFGYLRLMAALYANNKKQEDEFYDLGCKISTLAERLNDKLSAYSKGMTRKLMLARALMTHPKLAILDEPTSGLDVINATEIRKIIKDYAKNGMAVLLSSHNMLEIEFLSDIVAIIDKGIIHEIGKPQDLKNKYKAANLEEVFLKVVK